MASSGGSIQLRVGLSGAEGVKTALAELGPVGARALRQIEESQKSATAAMRALDAASENLHGKIHGLAEEGGSIGEVFKAIGPAGLAAAAGIGAIVVSADKLVESTKQAMEFADKLDGAAGAAGVSTTALQQWRFALINSGGEAANADEAVKSFATTFGLAGEGVQKSLKFFEKLGFTHEQLKGFKSVDEAMNAVVGRIADLDNAADRAAFAKRLGLSDLLPVIQSGSEHIRQLQKDALSMGAVMDEKVVKSLADAHDKFESASTVISVQFQSALVNVTPFILTVTTKIADLVKGIAEFLDKFASIKDQSKATLEARRTELLGQLPYAGHLETHATRGGHGPTVTEMVYNGPDEMVTNGGHGPPHLRSQHVRDELAQIEAALAKIKADEEAAAKAGLNLNGKPGGGFGDGNGKGGGNGNQGGHKRQPNPDAIEAAGASLLAAGQSDLDAARKAELTAQLALTTDITARAAIEDELAALDANSAEAARQKKIVEARRAEVEGKLTASALDQWLTLQNAAQVARETAAADKRILDQRNLEAQRLKEGAELDRANRESEIAILRSRQSLATNMQERRDLALQLYDLEYAEKIAQLEDTKAAQTKDGKISSAALTQIQIDTAMATHAGERTAIDRANPADGWHAMITQLTSDTGTLNQAFAQMAADGVAQFNQSLFDAQGRLQSLGTIAGNVFSRLLVDLEQYLVKQAEIGLLGGGGGLFGNLFGGLFGGAASADGSLISPALFGLFADGGMIRGPGGPRSDNLLIAASPGEFIVNADAARHYYPFLHAINSGQPISIPAFAAGGRVGGGATNGVRLGGQTVVFNIDRSIHAPGADAAALNRVAARQDDILRGEPERWVQYAAAAKRAGLFR